MPLEFTNIGKATAVPRSERFRGRTLELLFGLTMAPPGTKQKSQYRLTYGGTCTFMLYARRSATLNYRGGTRALRARLVTGRCRYFTTDARVCSHCFLKFHTIFLTGYA